MPIIILSDVQLPLGAASGKLLTSDGSGNATWQELTNVGVSATAAIAESKLALDSDAAAGTASRRTLGTGALQAAAGNDARFADQRVPTDLSVTNAKVAVGAAIAPSKIAGTAAVLADLLTYASQTYVQSRLQNLITNGSGLLNNNYNFTTLTFDPVETHGGGGSFKSNAVTVARFSDELIPVDTEKIYRLTGWAKAGDAGGSNYTNPNTQYLGVAPYDIDGILITTYAYQKSAGSTDTTLAVALEPGHTTMTLVDATGWYNGASAGSRIFAWWPYTNAKGYTYPDYTYSRNFKTGAWAEGGVSGNVITLAAPWAGATLPVGTPVRNTVSGGTYKYIAAAGQNVPAIWKRYSGVIGPSDLTGSGVTGLFPHGTSYVKLLFLINYHGVADSIRWSDLTFGEEVVVPVDSVTNLSVSATAAIAESKLALASDAAAGTASRRTLGTGALQAAAGNDIRFTDTRVPTDNSVTSAKIVDGAIMDVDVNAAAAIAPTKIAGTAVVTADIRLSDQRTPLDNSVTSAKIADGAIVNADINAAAAIAKTKLAALNIVNADVDAAAAIAESKLALASDAAAGTASRRTLGTGALQAASGTDARFTDTRVPTDLSVTNAKVSATAAIARSKLDFGSGLVNADINVAAAIAESKLALASDAAAGTASRRTLGTGATQAAAGNDARLNDARTPTGTAGGDLSGTYPNPEIGAGNVGTPELADLSVTAAKLALGAVTSEQSFFVTTLTGGTATTYTSMQSKSFTMARAGFVLANWTWPATTTIAGSEVKVRYRITSTGGGIAATTSYEVMSTLQVGIYTPMSLSGVWPVPAGNVVLYVEYLLTTASKNVYMPWGTSAPVAVLVFQA